ncbi:MAG: mannosyltransferase family protein [Bacillota bacterium]
MRYHKALVIAILGLMLAAFCAWAFLKPDATAAGILFAALSAALFALAAVRCVGPTLETLSAEPEGPQKAPALSRESRRLHPWFRILLFALLSRIAVLALAYAFDLAAYGYQGGLFERLYGILVRTDAPHYLGIAENWYVTVGDPRFHIVFFPLFPIAVRGMMFLIPDAFAASLAVSTVSYMAASILLYELALLDFGRKGAWRAVILLALLPAGFFFCAPMSESLFLMLSLGCLLLARKGRFVLAGACGALAAFTRSPGLLLIIPVTFEAARSIVVLQKSGASGRALWGRAFGRGGASLLIALGFLGYLYVNYAVTGNPFQFMIYQSEHWSQRLGLFFSTFGNQAEYALKALASGDMPELLGLWLPNLVSQLAALTVLLLSAKKLRPGYTLYALAYFAFTMGATWLLSAPRYLAGLCVIQLALAALARGKSLFAALAVVFCAAGVCYLYAFVAGYPVY